MSKTFEIIGSLSSARITWSEVNNFDANTSVVTIEKLELKSLAYSNVSYYLSGSIKVNGASLITFDSVLGTHAFYSGVKNNYYEVVAGGSFDNAPWSSGTITHELDGSKNVTFTVDITLYTIDKKYGNGQRISGSYTDALTDLPKCAYIVSAPNFFDVDNPTITYNNVLGSAAKAVYACISLTGAEDDIAYREINKLGTSYTFELTEEEREILLNNTQGSNSRTVRFYVKTINDKGETFFRFLDKQFTVSAPLPTLEPTVEDINTTTLSLTGDKTKFVKYNSHAFYNFNATPKKGATIESYSAVCGNEELTSEADVFFVLQYDTITFTVVDSRGNRATKEVKLDLIPYYKPTCSAEAEIELAGETSATATITATGIYWEGTFGAVPNQLAFQARYRINSSKEYTEWENIGGSISFDESGYRAVLSYEGLDYQKGYTFQVRAYDLVDFAESGESKQLKLIPVFDWSATDFNFNVPVTFQGNTLEDYVIAKGTRSMGSNGTWYFEKWKSGKAVCYGCRNYGNMAVNTAWGYLYISEKFSQSLPTSLFIDKPDYLNIAIRDGAGWIVKSNTTETSNTNTGAFFIARGNSETLSQVYINFYAVGRWQ